MVRSFLGQLSEFAPYLVIKKTVECCPCPIAKKIRQLSLNIRVKVGQTHQNQAIFGPEVGRKICNTAKNLSELWVHVA
jgi:hypothetical protein